MNSLQNKCIFILWIWAKWLKTLLLHSWHGIDPQPPLICQMQTTPWTLWKLWFPIHYILQEEVNPPHSAISSCQHSLLCFQFDREHFSEVFVDLKWFESKVGNKYLNEAAGLAAEEADAKDMKKSKVNISSMQPDGWYTKAHINLSYLHLKSSQTMSSLSLF